MTLIIQSTATSAVPPSLSSIRSSLSSYTYIRIQVKVYHSRNCFQTNKTSHILAYGESSTRAVTYSVCRKAACSVLEGLNRSMAALERWIVMLRGTHIILLSEKRIQGRHNVILLYRHINLRSTLESLNSAFLMMGCRHSEIYEMRTPIRDNEGPLSYCYHVQRTTTCKNFEPSACKT